MEPKRKIFDINNIIIGGLIFLVFSYCVTEFYIARKHLSEIEKNGQIIIAKFSEYKTYPKSRNYFFTFYYNGNEKKDDVIEAPKGFSNNIGKFYKIKYLDKYPDLIIVKFNQEVTDTSSISKAGF